MNIQDIIPTMQQAVPISNPGPVIEAEIDTKIIEAERHYLISL